MKHYNQIIAVLAHTSFDGLRSILNNLTSGEQFDLKKHMAERAAIVSPFSIEAGQILQIRLVLC